MTCRFINNQIWNRVWLRFGDLSYAETELCICRQFTIPFSSLPMRHLFNRFLPALLKFATQYFKATVIVLTTALCALTYVLHVEPNWIEIVPVTVDMPHLDPAFNGTRIVQISDTHMDKSWMTSQRLQRIVQVIEQQNPDLVVITGDLIDHDPVAASPLMIKPLTHLASQYPTFAVLGNHDYWGDPHPIRDALAKTPVNELANQVHTITRENAKLHITGVDDVWMKRDRLDLVLDQLPDDGAAILLVHEPDFADKAAATGRFDLALSGHSHGGQVRIPFKGAAWLPSYARRYPLGQYQVGNMTQYTNRGIGMSTLNVRFNCRPEITVFTLATTSRSAA
ncbi:MAG: metallophosphoesterase [Cyanobacteria bacterium P01_F01_bin.150]